MDFCAIKVWTVNRNSKRIMRKMEKNEEKKCLSNMKDLLLYNWVMATCIQPAFTFSSFPLALQHFWTLQKLQQISTNMDKMYAMYTVQSNSIHVKCAMCICYQRYLKIITSQIIIIAIYWNDENLKSYHQCQQSHDYISWNVLHS